ncbi:MAG TPA: glycine--tRNA ligase subunit beta [Allosphingosinicella sp.]|nr:glycine--tRNA ligase subunit beta [Allosphingosinicella sp.]
MTDFLLELLCEEIPARMQARAAADLGRLFGERLGEAGLAADAVETYVTPRRLALIARGLPDETASVSEEIKGPRTGAPPQALEGFLRKTGLARDQLVERDGIHFAVVERPGRAAAAVLADAIPAIVRAFPWPKSMRWGEASASTDSLRWVRPLQGIVALLGERIVDFEVGGVRSGAATVGHRLHHPGAITIGSANDYVEKLRACHVILDPAERAGLIRDGAARLAAEAGLTLVEDEGLVTENAGLTEWPVPLLGGFDPAFLEVPREVTQLTMRTNQKYFALIPPRDGDEQARHAPGMAADVWGTSAPAHDRPKAGGGGSSPGTAPPPPSGSAGRSPSPSRGGLAPNFVCVANLEAVDGGAAIVAGNRKVLAARLSDARYFWQADLQVPLAEQAKKLDQIVFHEKLGTIADKVERVARLAQWLIQERIVRPKSSPGRGGGPAAQRTVEGVPQSTQPPLHHSPSANGPPPRTGEDLSFPELVDRAARLAKADLVTQSVGEFPELQGTLGGYLARAQGQPDAVADAIRDHYRPAGQGDEVPTAPVTALVNIADRLDTLAAFFAIGEKPTGSRDPFALRRAALSFLQLLTRTGLRLPLREVLVQAAVLVILSRLGALKSVSFPDLLGEEEGDHEITAEVGSLTYRYGGRVSTRWNSALTPKLERGEVIEQVTDIQQEILDFFADRLKVQQREAGVRHDLIDAVFALGGEDDLVRLLARVKALQAFVARAEGADLLAGYKRAANILKREGWTQEQPVNKSLSYSPEVEESELEDALDSAEPRVEAALDEEDFERAMEALANLRGPVDAFFDKVTVNDPDPAKRVKRLNLLLRMRDAMHRVADFSRIEG